jgi:pimeloyl-ACP methyl ester carboxylesterase
LVDVTVDRAPAEQSIIGFAATGHLTHGCGFVETQMEINKDSQTEQVVLVHGTFASAAEDHGKAWWQIGSPAHQELEKRLPPGVELASDGDLFRWSGDNTERARSKAARQLLRHLDKHEKTGKPYHLVGHSHGGSVIWAALRLATARHKPLRALRSWSTVGTPFMHHRSRSPWNPMSVAYMILAICLLYPAGRCFVTLSTMPYALVTGQMDDGFILQSDKEVGFIVATTRAPAIWTT